MENVQKRGRTHGCRGGMWGRETQHYWGLKSGSVRASVPPGETHSPPARSPESKQADDDDVLATPVLVSVTHSVSQSARGEMEGKGLDRSLICFLFFLSSLSPSVSVLRVDVIPLKCRKKNSKIIWRTEQKRNRRKVDGSIDIFLLGAHFPACTTCIIL